LDLPDQQDITEYLLLEYLKPQRYGREGIYRTYPQESYSMQEKRVGL